MIRMKIDRTVVKKVAAGIFIGTTVIVFYCVSPQTLVEILGIKDLHLFLSALSLLGGLATLGGVSYHALLISLTAGGLNPFIPALVTAVGATLGNCLTYYLAYFSGGFIAGKPRALLEQLSAFQNAHPRLTPLIVFLYAAVMPCSNDVVVLPLGLSRYPLWRVMLPLFLGTVAFNLILTCLAAYAYDFLKPFII